MGISNADAEPGVLEAILLFYPSAVAAGRGGGRRRLAGATSRGGAALVWSNTSWLREKWESWDY